MDFEKITLESEKNKMYMNILEVQYKVLAEMTALESIGKKSTFEYDVMEEVFWSLQDIKYNILTYYGKSKGDITNNRFREREKRIAENLGKNPF